MYSSVWIDGATPDIGLKESVLDHDKPQEDTWT
jgi:hypothetical protein